MTRQGHHQRGLVRSHTVTHGLPTPPRTLDGVTLLIADPKVPLAGLSAQARRVMELCLPGELTVAEVSAHLHLPGAVVRSVVAGLIGSGHLFHRVPYSAAELDRTFLERVLDGLRKL